MTRLAVCLRCDWAGETRAATCPNCGVRLYRPVMATNRSPLVTRLRERVARVPAKSRADTGPVVARAPLAPSIGARSAADTSGDVEPVSRRGAGGALIAFAVLVTLSAVWFVQRHTPAKAPVGRRTGEVGSIVYEARSPSGQTRLYRWDLAANTVHPGPVVNGLLSLVDASGAHPGWVGATWSAPGGGVDIGMFKFLGASDQALPLGHGDVAAWAPHGVDAVVGTMAPLPGGCGRLSVLAIHVSPLRHEQTAGERVCATMDGISLSQRVTYLSLHGPRGSRIAFLSVGRLRTLLDGYRLDSLSPANDMVVTPDRADKGGSGAALYFRGPASQSPTPYRYTGAPFVLDRVLAWDPNLTEALALGSAAGRTGAFRLTAAPPSGPTQTVTFVGPTRGYSDAVYTGVTRIVFTDGAFSQVFDDSSSPLPLPAGAPAPMGPMVWIGA